MEFIFFMTSGQLTLCKNIDLSRRKDIKFLKIFVMSKTIPFEISGQNDVFHKSICIFWQKSALKYFKAHVFG